MTDISLSNNFFDKFPPNSGLATKKAITMEGIKIFYHPRNSLRIAVQLCALFSYLSMIRNTLFICLEQCFQLSLSDQTGCTFLDIDNF